MKLEKIQQVELREIWKHEALDFTRWLAESENLDLLSEEIDTELSLIDTEYNVWRFNVDIYAEESTTGRKVIIENQLENTDHDHLWKLITYASWLNAEIIIWIVKDVLEEHQQAIERLNENTDEKINFFAIKMEVWKIWDSYPAPKFHIIAQPNNWVKSVKQNNKNNILSDTKILQLKFWNYFKEYCQRKWINLRLRKVSAQHWYDISFGRSDCHLSLTVNSQKNTISCEVYIPNSKETFYNFERNKWEIEKEIGSLDWKALPNKKASRILITNNWNIYEEGKREEYCSWLSKTAISFQDIFNRY